MSNLQSENKEMKWIDIQDQLPHDGEEVWVCVLEQGERNSTYIQSIGKFFRASGWRTARCCDPLCLGNTQIHFWHPMPRSPEIPQWYRENQSNV